MDEFVRSTVRLDSDFQERVRIAIAKKRLRSFQAAVEQALELWLQAPKATTSPAAAVEPTEWHRKLTEILGSGDEATINAVTQNIDVFHDRLRPSRKRKAG